MSWPQWQGGVQPNVGSMPVVNPAPAAVPMGLQYTPEQWQQMQQQNWQQWAQWQQQYQQWHQQYGAEYQKTLNAMAGAAAAPVPPMPLTSLPPPLPQETKPPLPPDEPPVQLQQQKPQNYQGYSTVPTQPPPNFATLPPPDPNNFNNAPKPQNLQWKTQPNIPPPNAAANSIAKKPDVPKQEFGNKRPFTGNQPVAPDVKRNKFEQNWQDPASNPPPNPAEELSESEKKFMKQFAEWEAQFNKWKEQNQDHPDKAQYKEYEKKWEAWRNQLLERREQMRRKRLGLAAAQDPKPVAKPSGAQPGLQAKASTSDVLLKDKPPSFNDDANALGGRDTSFFTENLRNKPPPFYEQAPNVQDEPLQFKDRQSGYKSFNENSNDNISFLKSKTSGGIPGLDLVDENDKPDDDSNSKGENTDSAKPEQSKLPDLEALSKNINSILGDQKLLSMLNLVSQKQKPNETVTDAKVSETGSIANEVSRSSFNEDADSKSQFALSTKSDNYDKRADEVKPWEETNERNSRNFADNWGGGRDENQGQFNRNGPGQFNRPGSFNPPRGNRLEDMHDNMDMPDRFNVPPPGNRFDDEVGGRYNNRDPVGPGNGPDFEAPRQRFSYNNRTNDQNFNNYPRGDTFGRDSFNRRDADFTRPPPRVDTDNRWPNEERHNSFNRDDDGDMYSENVHGRGMDDEPVPHPQGNFNTFNNRPDNFSRRGPNEQNFNNFNRIPQNNSRGDNFNRNNRRPDHYDNHGDDAYDEDMRNYGRDGPEGFGDYDNDDENNFDPQEPYDQEGNWEPENNWSQEESFPADSEVPNVGDEAPPSEEMLIIENVTDYNHKPKKTAVFEVTVVPPHLFDYRHKTVNRIPLPERPKWLSETFRSIPEFEPSIGRPPVTFNRYQQPIQRFDYRSGPKQGRYNDHNSYNRRQVDNRRYEERRPKEDSYEPEYKKGRDDRFKREECYEPEYNKGRDDRYKKEEFYEPEYNKGRDDRFKREECYEPEYNKGRDDRYKKEECYEPEYNKGRDDRYKSDYDRGYEDRFDDYERGGREYDRSHESRNEKVRDRSPKVDFEHNRRSREPVKSAETFPIKQQSKPSNKPCNTVMIDDILKTPGRFKRPPRIVIILRGPPGSGKTFLAKLIKDKEVESGGSAPRILSLDDYFMVEQEKEVTEDGKKVKIKEMVYEYEECMESSYRTSLLKSFKKTITDGYFPFIIVDNVNDKIKYFNEMWSFAKQNGFEVYVCQLELDIQICTKRNEHGRSESDIKNIVSGWEATPSHYAMLDATNLIQDGSIAEVEMEEINSPNENFDDDEEIQEQAYSSSKWDNFECSIDNLAKLDGINKPLRSTGTMEDYLQMDEWKPKEAKPGQKRVRWADLEEQKEQEKMRAIGFVVGQTDWDRMMDPTQGGSALTKTKYIERVHNY